MKAFFRVTACLLVSTVGYAQQYGRTDAYLADILSQGSPALQEVLRHPDEYQVQIIYTQIDRDRHNVPHFKNYYYHVDRSRYFNPASTVKMPLSFLALQKINDLKQSGAAPAALDKYTPMLTDSAYSRQTRVLRDSTSPDGLPSVAHYIKKIFLVSDNDAYNRLYEFIGQQTINRELAAKGYPDSRVTRRFTPMNEDENRHTNPIRFVKDGRPLYSQPLAHNPDSFRIGRPVFIGKGYLNAKDSLINQPMNFTRHNQLPLEDLLGMLQSVMFPASVPEKQRFRLTEDDYRFLYQYMSQYPSETNWPRYDTTEYFDSYVKFFMFKADKKRPPAAIRVFNKPGWSYGFLTDASYIVDFDRKIEFMLSAVIYVNKDGILNDDRYEYDQTGYPFFREVGNLIYAHELKRKRRYPPDLSRFRLRYDR